jgi:hypothetical protein
VLLLWLLKTIWLSTTMPGSRLAIAEQYFFWLSATARRTLASASPVPATKWVSRILVNRRGGESARQPSHSTE